ncbi:MAG: hypothetical protein RL235_1048 [Chlamydiota bacterium]|jgi:putative hydrolase of the HAD superfamily
MKTVFFDIGNVLFKFSLPRMVAQVAHCTGMGIDAVEELIVTHQLQRMYEIGRIDSLGLYEAFRKNAPHDFTVRELVDAISDIFTPIDGTWAIVKELKDLKKQLIIISNTCESHFNYLYSHYPMMRLFDGRVLSYEVNLLKPDPLIFYKALAIAKCEAKESFFTDDVLENVHAARSVGLDAEPFVNAPLLRQELKKRLIL